MKKLGFGTMRLPLADKGDLKSIDMQELCRMVDLFMERGFNFFDTAYMYHDGFSERAMKTALVERYPRESFLLADKLPPFFLKSAADNERLFEEQLRRCGVSFFDYYLVHNLTKTVYEQAKDFGTFDFVDEMKRQGKIRSLGFSFHDDAELLEKILTEQPQMEFVLLQINYLDWEDGIVQAGACYEVARRFGKPIIAMEPIKGGRLAKLPEEALGLFEGLSGSAASLAVRFCASLPGVFMVLSGMSDFAQMDENTAFMQDFEPLSGLEVSALEASVEHFVRQDIISCTACNYCLSHCPKEIAISDYFVMLNEHVLSRNDSDVPKRYREMILGGAAKASDCNRCGACERVCPQHLKISKGLSRVRRSLEK